MNDSSSELRWQPGQMLLGKYRVDHVLGVGGMGAVIAATHIQLDQKVAMKFVHAEIAQHPEAVQRFIREARAAAQIRSEHVVRVSDVGALEDGSPYMVMEYLEGEDLEGALSRGVPATEVIVDYLLQACTGLLEAHQHGIVHRDLKPANLFLTKRRDGRFTVKVLDFGISKVQKPGDSALTQTSSLMGSPLYMSPEQMTRPKEVDQRADIWAMGVIAYEALTGHRPFNGDALPEICGQILALTPTAPHVHRPEIPPKLSAIVQKCLEKDPNARFQDVGQLMEALEPFAPVTNRGRVSSLPGDGIKTLDLGSGNAQLNEQPTQQAWAETAGPGTQLPDTPASKRSKAPLFAAVGAAVALCVGGLVALRGGEEPEAPSTAALVPEPPKAAEPPPAAPPAAPTHEAAAAPTPAPVTPSATAAPSPEPPKPGARPGTGKKQAAPAPEPAKPAAAPPAPEPAPVEAPKPPAKPKKVNPLDIDIK